MEKIKKNDQRKGKPVPESSYLLHYWIISFLIILAGAAIFTNLKGYSLSSGLGYGYFIGNLLESVVVCFLVLFLRSLFRKGRTSNGIAKSVLIGSIIGLILKAMKLLF